MRDSINDLFPIPTQVEFRNGWCIMLFATSQQAKQAIGDWSLFDDQVRIADARNPETGRILRDVVCIVPQRSVVL